MLLLAAALLCSSPPPPAAERPDKLADVYMEAVEELNRDHARKPKAESEEELAAKLPKNAGRALQKLLALDPGPDVGVALARAGEAALELALMEDFTAVRARLLEIAPDEARALGTALARPRFLLRGLGGLDEAYLERFAEVLAAVLEGYDELFGFEEWSKVPGKKLRVRVHLEDEITRPPHFAPQFAYHSEIDFPVIDAEAFRSPTADGKFLFYGLCHELGHVIAMWGDPQNEEDHHAWAHYTGVVLVEHLAAAKRPPEWTKELRDVRWRSLDAERERLEDTAPGLDDRDATLALFITLHDELGPGALGAAINQLDREDERRRVNGVRYYTFAELREGLLATTKKSKKRQRKLVQELLPR